MFLRGSLASIVNAFYRKCMTFAARLVIFDKFTLLLFGEKYKLHVPIMQFTADNS
jgi:hypothetical protein